MIETACETTRQQDSQAAHANRHTCGGFLFRQHCAYRSATVALLYGPSAIGSHHFNLFYLPKQCIPESYAGKNTKKILFLIFTFTFDQHQHPHHTHALRHGTWHHASPGILFMLALVLPGYCTRARAGYPYSKGIRYGTYSNVYYG